MLLRFDISAFGLQYPREYLQLCAEIIQEMYPSSILDEQGDIFRKILQNVSVEMPDGEFIYPPRGIGLGYYEDLKTIVMLSLLREYHPVSVFGDQGILPLEAYESIPRLIEFQYSIKFEKVETVCSTGKTRWCGHSMSPTSLILTKQFFEPLIGCLFSRFHWEKKCSLRALAIEFPKLYTPLQNRLCIMYERTFGYEFFKGESFSNFYNGGIRLDTPIVSGYTRTWKVEHMNMPYSNQWFDITYQTPFRKAVQRAYPTKIARDFQVQRKLAYRLPARDDLIIKYIDPIIELNKKNRPLPRLLPAWADALFLANHGMTTGSLTYGMSPENIRLAPVRQVFSSDPFRARATGGYKILTQWRSTRGPSQEWVEAADFLSAVDSRYFVFTRRTDLPQHLAMMHDELYHDTDMISFEVDKRRRSKRKFSSDESESKLDKLTSESLERIRNQIGTGSITNPAELFSAISHYVDIDDTFGNQSVQNEFGLEAEDEHFYEGLLEDLEGSGDYLF